MKKLLTISIMAMAVAAALLSFAADADDCAAKATSQARLPVVAIPDYLSTNGMVLAKRSLTEAILKAGCLPVVLPEMDDAAADQFLAGCDALVIGGGIGNHNYARRVKYEDRVISLAVKRGLPVVGICHGCQVLNRHFGGKLGPVPSDGKVVHKNAIRLSRSGERAEHTATVLPGESLMSQIFGEGEIMINSSHVIRCLTVAPGFRVTAQAEDGVIEAIQHNSLPIFGFQFHPEVYWTKDERFLELLRRALRAR